MKLGIRGPINQRLAIARNRLLELAGFAELIAPQEEYFAQMLMRSRVSWSFGQDTFEVARCVLPQAAFGFHTCQIESRIREFRIQFERPLELHERFGLSRS